MGPNQFSDLSLEEFQALPIRGFVKASERGLAYLGEHEDGEVAASVDWRKANNGCGGGNMETGFQFEEGVNVATETSY